MAVLNAGIAGNRLLPAGPGVGDSPLARFGRDVAAGAGVTDVVLHIGTNDIADGRSASEIIAGLQRFAIHTRSAGKRVFLTTVTPSGTGARASPAAAAVRDAVNAWMRSQGRAHADGVFDFAAAVADPARPGRLLPAFDSGDGLHLSAAGHHALAAAVDPAVLSGSPCLADLSGGRSGAGRGAWDGRHP
jgi:lysophospholipase L1-like esterase